jgi:hypothetical protein
MEAVRNQEHTMVAVVVPVDPRNINYPHYPLVDARSTFVFIIYAADGHV